MGMRPLFGLGLRRFAILLEGKDGFVDEPLVYAPLHEFGHETVDALFLALIDPLLDPLLDSLLNPLLDTPLDSLLDSPLDSARFGFAFKTLGAIVQQFKNFSTHGASYLSF
jgi:hypothetical protein